MKTTPLTACNACFVVGRLDGTRQLFDAKTELPGKGAVNRKQAMRSRKTFLALVAIAMPAISIFACIWDGDTLGQEKRGSPKLAAIILGGPSEPPDPRPLRGRIVKLRASPRESDPSWWNDLAGAHLRLGEATEAVRLLEPLVTKFPNDYGIHANLGTAYHLLGRYADAERHIARDLEINPDAHFGLERYHLALLQYLVRDNEYQKSHLFVDECSGMLGQPWFARALQHQVDRDLLNPEKISALKDGSTPPNYRLRWNLAEDPKFEEGVVYMATLNMKEPACYTMLGVACLRKGNEDLHLAVAAFKRAIELGSPQRVQLEDWVKAIEKHIAEASSMSHQPQTMALTIAVLCGLILMAAVVFKLRKNSAK